MAGTATPIASPVTGNARTDALLWGAHWSSGTGTTLVSTYIAGLLGAESLPDGYGGRVLASVPSTAEVALMTAAMASFEAVCDIDFVTVSDAAYADLVWASVDDSAAFGALGWANPPGTGQAYGDSQALIALNHDMYQTGSGPDALQPGGLDQATALQLLGLAVGSTTRMTTPGSSRGWRRGWATSATSASIRASSR